MVMRRTRIPIVPEIFEAVVGITIFTSLKVCTVRLLRLSVQRIQMRKLGYGGHSQRMAHDEKTVYSSGIQGPQLTDTFVLRISGYSFETYDGKSFFSPEKEKSPVQRQGIFIIKSQ